MAHRIDRRHYADLYGPTRGDRIVRGGNAWASGPVVEGRDLGSWE